MRMPAHVTAEERRYYSILWSSSDTAEDMRPCDLDRVLEEAADLHCKPGFLAWLLTFDLLPRTRQRLEAECKPATWSLIHYDTDPAAAAHTRYDVIYTGSREACEARRLASNFPDSLQAFPADAMPVWGTRV